MRKFFLMLLSLLMIPSLTSGAPKHAERLHNKLHEMGHKKRMKKAAKQDPGAKKKHSLLKH